MVVATEKRSTIEVPHWVLIAIVGAIMLAIAGFIVYAVSGPSDADLYARAAAGDAEAGETLAAKYAEPTPEFVPTEAERFTTRTYTKGIPSATELPDVIASFFFFATQGSDDALRLVDDQKEPSMRETISLLAKENLATFVITGYDVTNEGLSLDKEPSRDQEYRVVLDATVNGEESDAIIRMILRDDGWKIVIFGDR